MKIAVIGASGLIGATLVEQLRLRREMELVPFIHSSGNSGRVGRLGIGLQMLDLMDKGAVVQALRDCTHVVNCTRGDDNVMLKGLRNLIQACRQSSSIQRLIHISSVAVYGDPPCADSVTEDGRTEPERGTYGWIKLQQDKLLAASSGSSLSAIALCPPNISGAQSVYLQLIVDALKKRELRLLDEGNTPCNLVDVCNLAHAIELALERGPCDGSRLFITDDWGTTWRDVVDNLIPLVGIDVNVPAIDRDSLVRLAAPPPPPDRSLRKSLLHVVSSDVRQAMRKDPLWASVDTALRNSVRNLGEAAEDRFRLAVEGPVPVTRVETPALNVRLCAQQLRGVAHSCDRAKELLRYKPLYSFQQSMAAFRRWYEVAHGWDTEMAPLLKSV